ncbi:MAG TPA: hypothetical protein HA272_06515 [Methanoregula sp.]|nr:hypothetical protein [Methanoregula sp.]
MRRTGLRSTTDNDTAVANMIEYVMVSGVVMCLLMVMLLLVNSTIMEGPANRLSYVAFTDVGNGISTRIVDVYAIAPRDGELSTRMEIPPDIAGKVYYIEIGSGDAASGVNQDVTVYRDSLSTKVALAGIGASKGVVGNTSSRGMKRISYSSKGY